MKKVLLFLLIGLLPVGLFAQQGDNNQQKTLVFTHATVIDTTGAPAKTDMTVVVKGEQIESLGKTGILTVPQNARVVDAAGKFLIPGLWDMHIHPFDKRDTHKEYLALFIANGITGVRVMWGHPLHHKWRKEILAGELIGPRMIISGNPSPGDIGNDDNEEQARQFVRKIKSDGADLLKVGRQDIPHDIYFAMADEANKLGIPFAGHLPYFVTLAEASDAGLQSLEHTVFVVFATSSESEEEIRMKAKKMRETGMTLLEKYELPAGIPYSEKKAAEIFARLAKNGTWVCPKLVVRYQNLIWTEQSIDNEPRFKYLPIFARNTFKRRVGIHSRGREIYDILDKFTKKNSAIVGAMNDAGVGLLAGTDSYIPGLDLQDELAVFVQAGLSPMEALQTATYNAAKFLGLLDSMGTVERGKVADLVLLDADPRQDINNTRKIVAVVVGGKIFDKPAIQKMLARVEALEPPLHRAVNSGNIEQVKLLISEGADVNVKSVNGWTPLHHAADRGHREMVELLLAHDADVNVYESNVKTAAEYAMKRNHTEIVQLLISKGADISPLHFAIYMKDEARARSLIEGGADVNKRTPDGAILLNRALSAGFTEIAELLIAKGADVNVKSSWDWTPLHGAAEEGYKDIVELLITAGANVNVRDKGGRTPLWYAENKEHTEIAEMLRKRGAKE